MKSRTGKKRLWTLFAFCGLCVFCQGQVSQSNVLQYAIMTVGTDSINKSLRQQGITMAKIATEANSMALAFDRMKEWEMQYNSYLTNVGGYASAIKGATTLYAEAVMTFQNLMNIKKAIAANPQGTVASLSMNNLYVEVTVELVKTFRLLKAVAYNEGKGKPQGVIGDFNPIDRIDKGGVLVNVVNNDTVTNRNMMTGAERTQLLWELNDGLAELNRKLRALAVSIAYYNFKDVWNHATSGMIDKTHGDIAKDARERWRRSAKVQKILSD